MPDTPSKQESCAAPGTRAHALRLPQYAFISVEGAKASTFLQGQLSCNLDDASADAVIPGAYCTPKGRVIANFLLHRPGPERCVLRVRTDILDDTIAALNKYGVFSRVTIGETQPQRGLIGLIGGAARDSLTDLLPDWPSRSGELRNNKGILLLQRDASATIHEIWAASDAIDELWRELEKRLETGDDNDWRLALIRNGAAEIQAASRDQFLPQMLAYDRSGAVNFRKGCYTGQEIVARTHYKGAVKRHLQRLAFAADAIPPVGLELVAPDTGRSVGTVVETARAGPGECEMLAVLADDATTEKCLKAAISGANSLRLLDLPCAMI